MIFAWQGFQIEHPDDWAPTLIAGQRTEGYVRIASPEALSYQIRWNQVKRGYDAKRSLDDYLAKIARDAKKLKTKFSSRVEQVDGDWQYNWSGAGNGKGSLVAIDERVFFLEASSITNRSVQGAFRDLRDSFRNTEASTELWSVFGLSVRLRSMMAVEKHVFQSGRTRIEWRDKLGRVVAERWGFGEQILAKHPFEEWAMNSMAMPKAKVKDVERGLELEVRKPLLRIYGLATADVERNQLITLKTISRGEKGRAEWGWLI